MCVSMPGFNCVIFRGWKVALGVGRDWVALCGVLVVVIVVLVENFPPFALSAGLMDLRISIFKRHWVSILEF